MKILVACEWSGRVRDAFIRKGHDAVSCDLLDTAVQGPHYRGDVRDILYDRWDMVVAFPPCTHLASSGAAWFEEKRKDGRQQEAVDFFMLFTDLPDCPRVAIENPVGIMSRLYRKPDQIIQPWWFGHPRTKKTCMWLKGLPLLTPTSIVEPEFHKNPDGTVYRDRKGGRYSIPAYSGRHRDRAHIRGKTYQGVAEAIAEQWSNIN